MALSWIYPCKNDSVQGPRGTDGGCAGRAMISSSQRTQTLNSEALSTLEGSGRVNGMEIQPHLDPQSREGLQTEDKPSYNTWMLLSTELC